MSSPTGPNNDNMLAFNPDIFTYVLVRLGYLPIIYLSYLIYQKYIPGRCLLAQIFQYCCRLHQIFKDVSAYECRYYHMFNEHFKNIFTTRYLRQISHLSFEQFPFLCSNNYPNCPKYNLNFCSKTEPVTFRADATGHMSGSGLRIRIHFLRIRIQ